MLKDQVALNQLLRRKAVQKNPVEKRKKLAQGKEVSQKRNPRLRKRNLQSPIPKQKSILIEEKRD